MASVLIVESDQGFRVFAQVIYRDAGHRVTCAGDADQALTMLESGRFDVALIGGLSGGTSEIELVKARSDRLIAPATRVVLHTDDHWAAAELQFCDPAVEILPKPARIAELLALTRLGSGLELV